MRNLSPIVLFVTLCLIVFIGCSEESPVGGAGTPVRGLSIPIVFDDYSYASNPNNPYDLLGAAHNQGLQYVAEYCDTYGWPDSANAVDVAASLIDEYLQECVIFRDADSLIIPYPLDYADSLAYGYEEYFVIPDSIFTPYDELSYSAAQVLADIYDALDTSANVDKIAQITSVENQVINDSASFTDSDYHTLLCGLAIARYSQAYWTDTLRRPDWPVERDSNGDKIYLEMGKDPDPVRDDGSGNENSNWVSDAAMADLAGGAATFVVVGGTHAIGLIATTSAETLGASVGPAISYGAGQALVPALQGGLITSAIDGMQGFPLGKRVKGWIKGWLNGGDGGGDDDGEGEGGEGG